VRENNQNDLLEEILDSLAPSVEVGKQYKTSRRENESVHHAVWLFQSIG
jgi:hypothetical protein